MTYVITDACAAVEVLAPIASPNGARRHGPLGVDHPHIAGLPPRASA